MGLKKSNVTIKGYFYPEVYAVFNGEIEKIGNNHIVYFNLNGNREAALVEGFAVEKVTVKNWDRKSDLVATAYQQGKEPIIIEIELEDGTKQTVMKNNVFTGWEDDKI